MATDSARLQILIVGGGLAGLAAASYLREQHNVTASPQSRSILERSKLDFSRNDYAISVAPNTQRLLREQGMEESQLKSTVLTYIWRCDADGRVVRESLSESLARLFAYSDFCCAWETDRGTQWRNKHIYTSISTSDGIAPFGYWRSATRKTARIIKEVKITTVDAARGTIKTESGDTYSGDLIIIRAPSTSRLERRQYPAGLLHICAPFPSLPCAMIRCSLFRQIVAYVPEDGWVEQFTTSGSSTIKDVPVERALHDFSEFHPSIRQLFTTATTRDVVRIRDLDLLPEWHSGKAILIGDAAHAVTPHFGAGSNAAIEDAEALDTSCATSHPRSRYLLHSNPSSRQVGGRLSEEERNKAGPFDVEAFIAKTSGYTSAKDEWEALKAEH
ncbi:hypothetical protein B0H13DRAFT_1879946 [Mycena leptocephala]|nr:hypothetical protein B0H13DRAFT_1879946 [Mycena leptocephala]